MEVTAGLPLDTGSGSDNSSSRHPLIGVGGPNSAIFNLTVLERRSCGVNNSWPAILTSGLPAADVDFRLAVDVYLVGALCLVGFLGNAFTVAVLRSDADGRNNSTNWLLQTLALVDTMYLAACLFIQPLKVC